MSYSIDPKQYLSLIGNQTFEQLKPNIENTIKITLTEQSINSYKLAVCIKKNLSCP